VGGHERIGMMTLTYSELMDFCSLGERLRFWRMGYPSHENGLGVRVLRQVWQFVPATDIEVDPELSTIVQEIIDRREPKEKQR
jgi:hypothetical protein